MPSLNLRRQLTIKRGQVEILSRWLIYLALSLWCIAPHGAGAEDDAPSPQLRFVLAGIENARVRLKSFEAEVKYYRLEPKEISLISRERMKEITPVEVNTVEVNTQDAETTEIGKWAVQDQKASFVLTRNVETFDSEKARTETILLDGVNVYLLFQYGNDNEKLKKASDGGLGSASFQGSILSPDMFTSGVRQSFDKFNPRRLAFGGIVGNTFDQMAGSPHSCKFAGKATLYDSECYIFNIFIGDIQRLTYWIDIDHDFVIRRVDWRIGRDYSFGIDMITVPRLQYRGGVWLPAVVERRGYHPLPVQGKGNPLKSSPLPVGITRDKLRLVDGFAVVPPVYERYTISDLRVNEEIPTERFVMHWPAGAVVFNRITGKPVATASSKKDDAGGKSQLPSGEEADKSSKLNSEGVSTP